MAKIAQSSSAAGVSNAAVLEKTGKSWSEWLTILDAAQATAMPHKEIAAYLHEEHQLPFWWAQMVTVSYERIRGLRDIGQRRGGKYDANKSKTFAAPISQLYAAFSEA